MAININHQSDTICATGGTLNLPDFSAAGFSPDADKNLLAGTCAGEDLDGSNGCYNVLIGECAGMNMTSGADNIAIGCKAASGQTVSGANNILMGQKSGQNLHPVR